MNQECTVLLICVPCYWKVLLKNPDGKMRIEDREKKGREQSMHWQQFYPFPDFNNEVAIILIDEKT